MDGFSSTILDYDNNSDVYVDSDSSPDEEELDVVPIVPNYDMRDLLHIVSYRSNDDGEFQAWTGDNEVPIVLDPDAVVNDVLAKKIDDILSRISLDAVHESRCVLGCRCQFNDSFWKNVINGSVKISILKYLIKKNYIDLTNAATRRKLLEIFNELLTKSGIDNDEGHSDRIHVTTEFFFKILSENMLEEMRTFRGCSFGESLIHSAFYSDDFARKQEYINRLIDLGVNLYLTHNPPINDDNHSDSLEAQIWWAVNMANIKTKDLIGQSAIYLAALEGLPEILKRMLALPGADLHLRSYEDQAYSTEYSKSDDGFDVSVKRYSFQPIIVRVLACWPADTKDEEYLKDVAEAIRLLIKAGADPLMPILYPTEKFEHNISDFLGYYGYIYQGSPIAEVFMELGIKLPERLDPDDAHFKMMKDRSNAENIYGSKKKTYELVFEKYKYVKDLSRTKDLLEELETVLFDVGSRILSYHALISAAKGWGQVPDVKKFIEEKTGYVEII